MFDLDRWNEILQTITRNRTRSILTAFGVFWGIFMLIMLTGGGGALEKLMKHNMDGIATNSCMMWAGRTSEAWKGFRKGRYWTLNNGDVNAIKQMVTGFDVVSPVLFGGGMWGGASSSDNVVRGDRKGTYSAQGMYASYNRINRFNLIYGRFINEVDVLEERKVCVIGTQVYETLFLAGEDPVGQNISVDGVYYKVVGVGNCSENMSFNGNNREHITIPFTTMQKLYRYGDRIDLLVATALPHVAMGEVQSQMETIIKNNHAIAPSDRQALNSFNLESIFNQVNNLFLGVNILAWIVGLGTLFAGIIGVSNIMMVTVRERTQEIGIRRAMGASPVSIMSQIMSESFTVTAISGFLGISFGVLGLQLVDLGTGMGAGNAEGIFQIDFALAVIAAVIIIILGTFAGLGPAFRAMKIKPIEALSEE